jgi:hypothetical protein
MEPNLDDISDYNKPLDRNKTKTIIIVFAVLIALYAVYALIMGGL